MSQQHHQQQSKPGLLGSVFSSKEGSRVLELSKPLQTNSSSSNFLGTSTPIQSTNNKVITISGFGNNSHNNTNSSASHTINDNSSHGSTSHVASTNTISSQSNLLNGGYRGLSITNNYASANYNHQPSFSNTSHVGVSQNHNTNKNQFVLKIPPVPDCISKVIANKVSSSHIANYSGQESRIRMLTLKRNDQKERLQMYSDQLQELENEKEMALSALISSRRKEKEIALAAMEDKLRSESELEYAKREKAALTELDELCAKKRKELREKHELQCKEDQEQSLKRLKLLEPVEQADDGSAEEQQQLLVLLDETNNEHVQNAKKKIEQRQLELNELEKDNLSKLMDSKSEMVWLLKQVIKAEQKQRKVLQQPSGAISSSTAGSKPTLQRERMSTSSSTPINQSTGTTQSNITRMT